MIGAILQTLRPQQWAKNVFVLAPLVFSQSLLDTELVGRAAVGFLLFCTAASAVYVLNDLRDADRDRHHPLKQHRPIASGRLPATVAIVLCAFLAGTATIGGWLLSPGYFAFVATYLVLNLFYSFGLKRVVILDVMIISIGFVLRVMAGGAAIDVKVSPWLILCTIFVSLFLAFSKRRHELTLLTDHAADQRQVLVNYSPAFLDQMINVVTASTVVAYALYAISPETEERFHTPYLIYTIPLVLFGIFRYLYLVYQEPGEHNPTEEILGDKPFLINIMLWAVVVVAMIYVGNPE